MSVALKSPLLSCFSVLFIISCGGSGTTTPAPTPVNAAPIITSAATVSTPERAAGVIYTLTGNDANGDSLSFSISGGSDSSLFSIGATNGELIFNSAPDFEQPSDTNSDNIYEVRLSASDGTATTSLDLSITVTDVSDTPIVVKRLTTGLNSPVYVVHANDGSDRLFIVEQRGQIRIFDTVSGSLTTNPFLDLGGQLSTGGEQGLLGLAFAPDYATSGLFYVNITDTSGDTNILEFSVDTGNAERADPSSERLILQIDQPAGNHNAGWIGFGPDGFLYIPTGDGGGSGDPQNNAQDTDNLLGAVLRIDPATDDFPADTTANYAIPTDNPFVGASGRDEIWAYGLRNPFRASFDRATGDLYIGDVGQNAIEEIDLLPANESGLNFGWNIVEGTMNFNGSSDPSLTPPIAEYEHTGGPTGGFSVTGGYVHRGGVEALRDSYIFADFVSGNVWSLPVATISQGTTIASADFINRTQDLTNPDVGSIGSISSFGEDEDGELYIVEYSRGELYRVENAP